jgi:hypothetical protein
MSSLYQTFIYPSLELAISENSRILRDPEIDQIDHKFTYFNFAKQTMVDFSVADYNLTLILTSGGTKRAIYF